MFFLQFYYNTFNNSVTIIAENDIKCKSYVDKQKINLEKRLISQGLS